MAKEGQRPLFRRIKLFGTKVLMNIMNANKIQKKVSYGFKSFGNSLRNLMFPMSVDFLSLYQANTFDRISMNFGK